jgi:hypothetical protein
MSEAQEIKRDSAKFRRRTAAGARSNKGDAIIDGYWLVDYKEYPKGFTVNLDAWAKICTDAIRRVTTNPL